jgi:hypothetical protein
MSGPKRVQNMNVPAASDKEIRLIWAAIQDIDRKVTEQVAAPIIVTNTEQSLINDSIGM